MHSIYPLLKLLPPEDFQQRNGECILSRLTPDSTSTDWHRVEYYGRRIKAFYHDPNSLPTMTLPFHTCCAIQSYFPSSLFPKIDSLHIGSFDPISDAVLFMMASSPLRRVDICKIQPCNRNLVDSLLTCLREKAQNIQHLTLGGICPSQFPQWAGYLTGLISLDLTQLDLDEGLYQPTIRGIANLPLLRTLMLDLAGGIGPQLPETVWSAPIDHLTLKGSISQIAAFLNCHEMAHIRDIRLEFPACYAGNVAPLEDWIAFQQILSLVVSRWSEMQGVVLDIERFLNSSVRLHRQDFPEVIEPLTVLTQLRRLRILPETSSVSCPGLSATDYWTMAKAFPALEHLALPLARGNVITFEGLYKFALRCPRLRFLVVGIDTQLIPTTQYPAVATDLEILSVGDSPLHNFKVHSITRHLNQLFPRLKTIISTNAAWNDVQDLLKLYRSMMADSSERREVTSALVEELEAEDEVSVPSIIS
ncbi:hypothetical protein BDN72DRAFT_956755 [Pluteus cervinus]|uniref:Uncharacterized protein n=1 Tax=Pluteus cervinus TaxID=181527 RepID=A0ACD3B5Q8_9AGAR|nr:hypothetical protein BDN72DRAFT_956755 [Pluteus cervinus]